MTEVDQRVVSLLFDNKQFEQNVNTTIDSLTKLRNSLNLEESAQSLKILERSMNNIDTSGIEKGIDKLNNSFSAMGQIGAGAFQKIGQEAVSAGHKIFYNLTKGLNEGMATYQERVKSTQITMNALGLQGKNGEKIVSSYLDELNKYSDETIYRFSDMTSSLSKFVSAGVDVNTATKAIKGLGNAAALSGASTADFSRAIYNVSQALGAGKMMTRDWMSIENANMATREFKQTLIDTAVQLGYVDEKGKLTAKGLQNVNSKSINSAKDLTITYKNLRDSLSTGWLNNEVLMGALQKYADETGELGKKGKAAATEVKTFSQMMDTLGDSVATKWSNIYTNVIGGYNEAKELWTGVSGILEKIIVGPLEKIQDLTAKWKEMGGRNDLLAGLKIQLIGIRSAMAFFKKGWEQVFPKSTTNILYEITKLFAKFSYYFATFINQHGPTIMRIGRGIASVIKLIIEIVAGLIKVATPVLRVVGSVLEVVFQLIGDLGDLFYMLESGVSATDAINVAFSGTAKVLGVVADRVAGFFHGIAQNIKGLASLKGLNFGIKKFNLGDSLNIPAFKRAMTYGESVLNLLKSIGVIFVNLGKVAAALGKLLVYNLVNVNDALTDFNEKVAVALLRFAEDPQTAIAKFSKTMVDGIKTTAAEVASFLQNGGITKIISDTWNGIKNIANGIKNLAKTVNAFFDSIPEIADIKKKLGFKVDTAGAQKAVENVGNVLKAQAKNIDTTSFSVDGASNAIKNAAGQIQNSTKSIIQASRESQKYKKFWSGFKSGMGKVGKGVVNGGKTVGKGFTTFGKGVVKVFTAIGHFFATVGKGFATFFSALNQEVQKNGGWITVITRMFRMFVEGDVLTKISGMLDKLAASIKNVSKSLQIEKKSQARLRNAKAFYTSAKAILVLAGSIVVLSGAVMMLSMVKSDRLWDSVAAVTALVGAVTGAVVVITLVENKMKQTEKKARGWAGLFGHTIPDTIAGGIETLGQTLKGKLMGQSQETDSMSKKMLSLAASVGILTGSLYLLSKLDLQSTLKGLLGLAGVVAVLAGAMAAMDAIENKFKQAEPPMRKMGSFWQEFKRKIFGVGGKKESMSNRMLKLAITVGVLTASVAKLATIPWKQLWTGVGALGAIMGMLIGTSAALALINKKLGKSSLNSFLFLGFSLNLIVKPIKELGAMPFDQLKQGLISIAVAVYGFVGAMALLKKIDLKTGPMLAFAGAIAIIAPGLLTIAAALSVLSLTNPVKMAEATASLVLVMASFAGVISSLGNQIKNNKAILGLIPILAGSLDLLALSFMGFSTAISVLSLTNPAKMGEALGVLLTPMLAFAVIVAKFGNAVKDNQQITKIIPLFAFSMLLLAKSFKKMTAAFLPLMLFKPTKILSTLALFSGLMITFAASSAKLGDAIDENKWVFASAAMIVAAMYALAPAIDMMCDSFQKLSKVNGETLIGVGAAISMIMYTFAKAASEFGDAIDDSKWAMLAMPILAGSMVLLAPAVKIMAEALGSLANVDSVGVLAAATAISEIMVTLSVASGIFGKMVEKSKWSLLAMPLLAASMNILAPALKKMAEACKAAAGVDWESVGKMTVAFLAIAGVFTGLSGIAGLLAKAAPLMIVMMPLLAISLRVLAPALIDMANACKVMSGVDWGAIGKFTVAFLAFAGIATGLSMVMSLLPVAALMLPVMAIALGQLVGPLGELAKILPSFQKVKWSDIGKMCVSLLALGPGLIVATPGVIAMAGALAVLGAALNGNGRVIMDFVTSGCVTILTSQLKTLTEIDGAAIILTLLQLAGGMAVMGPAMLILSAGVATLGAALNGNGQAFMAILQNGTIPMLVAQLTALSQIDGAGIVMTLLQLAGGMAVLGPAMALLSVGVVSLAGALNSNGQAFMTILQSNTIPMLVEQLTALSQIDGAGIIMSMLQLAGGMAVLGPAMAILSVGVLTLGAAMNTNGQVIVQLIQQGVIPMLVTQLQALTAIDGASIILTLLQLAGGMAVLGPAMMLLSAGVATLGAALNGNDGIMMQLLAGNIIPMLVENLTKLTEVGGGGIVLTLLQLAGGLTVLSPALIIFAAAYKAADAIIGQSYDRLMNYIQAITKYMSTMMKFMSFIENNADSFIQEFSNDVFTASYTIPEAIADALVNMSETIAARAPEVVASVEAALKSVDKAINKADPQYRAQIKKLMNVGTEEIVKQSPNYATASESLTAGMSNGINRTSGGVWKSIFNAIAGFFKNLPTYIKTFFTSGINLGASFIKGLMSPAGLDEHSPSKKTKAAGDNAVAGFFNSIVSHLKGFFTQGENSGKSYTDGLISSLADGFGDADKMVKQFQQQINDQMSDFSFDTSGMNVVGGSGNTYTKQSTTIHGGVPAYIVYKNGKFWKIMSKSDYTKWNNKRLKKKSNNGPSIDTQLSNMNANFAPTPTTPTPTTPTTSTGTGKTSKGSGSSGNSTDSLEQAQKEYAKSVKAYEKANTAAQKQVDATAKIMAKINKLTNPGPALKRMKGVASAFNKYFKNTDLMKNAKGLIKNVGMFTQNTVWTEIYKKSDDFKKADKQRKKDLATIKKYKGLETNLKKMKNRVIDLQMAEKNAQKQADKNTKKQTKSQKAANKKASQERKKQIEETTKNIQAAQKKLDNAKPKLDDARKDLKNVTKEIKNGPNKAFAEMFENVKKNLTDTLKITQLSGNAGLNMFSHFQYNGTKRQYEKGKVAHNYAGYGQTQIKSYKNWISDMQWLRKQKGISSEMMEYFENKGYEAADELHAVRYATKKDLKQISKNFSNQAAINSKFTLNRYNNNVRRVKEWGTMIKDLAKKGIDKDSLKDIVDEGYSDSNFELVKSLLGLSPEQLKKFRSQKKVAKSVAEEVMAAYGYAYAEDDPAVKKALSNAENVGKQMIKKIQKDANKKNGKKIGKLLTEGLANGILGTETLKKLTTQAEKAGHITYKTVFNTIAKHVINLVKKDAKKGEANKIGKYLTDGLTKGILDEDSLARLVKAAGKTGHITLSTVKKTLKEHSPSKETFKMGAYVTQGLINGMDSGTAPLRQSARNVADATLSTLQSAYSNMDSIQPKVTPVVDPSYMYQSVSDLKGTIGDTTADLAAEAQKQLAANKAINQFNQSVTLDNSDVISYMKVMNDNMLDMQKAISKMQVQIDGKALVGEIVQPLDSALGKRISTGRR